MTNKYFRFIAIVALVYEATQHICVGGGLWATVGNLALALVLLLIAAMIFDESAAESEKTNKQDNITYRFYRDESKN